MTVNEVFCLVYFSHEMLPGVLSNVQDDGGKAVGLTLHQIFDVKLELRIKQKQFLGFLLSSGLDMTLVVEFVYAQYFVYQLTQHQFKVEQVCMYTIILLDNALFLCGALSLLLLSIHQYLEEHKVEMSELGGVEARKHCILVFNHLQINQLCLALLIAGVQKLDICVIEVWNRVTLLKNQWCLLLLLLLRLLEEKLVRSSHSGLIVGVVACRSG